MEKKHDSLSCETKQSTLPAGRCIEAIIGQEVIIEFPEDVQCDTTIRCRYIMIGFTEHGIKLV